MRLTAPISPGCHSPSFGPVTSAFFLPHSTRAASLAPLLFVGVERHLGNGLIAFLGISIFACLPAVLSWIVETPSPPARLKLKGSQTELGGEVEMLPLRGADEHTFSRAHGKRQSSIGGVDLGILFFEFADTPPYPHMSHPVSPICHQLIHVFLFLGSREAFIRYTVLAPMLLMITLTIGAEVAYAAWVYTYAIERQGMSPTEAAWLNSLFWSSFTVGRVILTALAAFFPPAVLLIPTLALASASNLMVLVDPSSSELLWFGTAGAGLGACALFSNSISLLAYYDLSTADTTGALCVACAVGHMTIPNLIGHCIQHTASPTLPSFPHGHTPPLPMVTPHLSKWSPPIRNCPVVTANCCAPNLTSRISGTRRSSGSRMLPTR